MREKYLENALSWRRKKHGNKTQSQGNVFKNVRLPGTNPSVVD